MTHFICRLANPAGPEACFLKVPKLFGSISGATIPYISSQHRGSKQPNFAILLGFSYIKNMLKISISYQADCNDFDEWPFRPKKPFVKLRPAYSLKLVFSYVVKGWKIQMTVKSRASRRLRFQDTKRIMSPEMRPKSFGTSEKRASVLTNGKLREIISLGSGYWRIWEWQRQMERTIVALMTSFHSSRIMDYQKTTRSDKKNDLCSAFDYALSIFETNGSKYDFKFSKLRKRVKIRCFRTNFGLTCDQWLRCLQKD